MTYEKKENLTGKVAEGIKSIEEINFKERFGTIPKSIMKFKKSKELMELIDYDDSNLRKVEGEAEIRGHGYAKKLGYSIYNPDQAHFIIDYYTKLNDLILDPFMGRATRLATSLYLNRQYVGFDINKETCQLNQRLAFKKFPGNDNYQINHGDGIELDIYSQKEFIDAVFTCPPYYWAEKYGGEPEDLSHMSFQNFNKRILRLFERLYELVKFSSYKTMEFHPVIFTVGSVRSGEYGLIDMDRIFQSLAIKTGFVLHDKLFTENISPGAGFTFRRNYLYRFVSKNFETTLVFMKYRRDEKLLDDDT